MFRARATSLAMTVSTTATAPILYGIPNCDTVKKARTWLSDHGIDFAFHDFKKQGLDEATVAGWLRDASWETLVNRKGTTWRNLDEASKAAVVDAASATALMLATPSVIKRPVLVGAGPVQVGFAPERYAGVFAVAP
jgi:arsenate reductase (glutaredoxin)